MKIALTILNIILVCIGFALVVFTEFYGHCLTDVLVGVLLFIIGQAFLLFGQLCLEDKQV